MFDKKNQVFITNYTGLIIKKTSRLSTS